MGTGGICIIPSYKACRNHHFYEKFGYTKIGEFQPDPNNAFKLFEYKKEIVK